MTENRNSPAVKISKGIQMTTYYAHSAQDELGNLLPYEHWQTLQSHSVNVGEMAAEFARVFGAQEIACQTGKLHDLGKHSEPFNHRLHGGPSVDHATAGAKIAVERWGNVIGKLMAFCIAGHHVGLANGNSEGDNGCVLKLRTQTRQRHLPPSRLRAAVY